jgi:catechol 2,3-dioxygenase-like lactoylglutathione lyase family enzyme
VKRLHVSLSVKSVPDSVEYYTTLFGRRPDVLKPAFAKWWLDDPQVNFALNAASGNPGLNHLGIEVDDEADLVPYYQRAKEAGMFAEEGDTEWLLRQIYQRMDSRPAGRAVGDIQDQRISA